MSPTSKPRHSRRSFAVPLTASAVLLIGSWVVPDVVADSSHFAWDRLSVAGGFEIAAVLTPPACGALLLLAVMLPIGLRSRAVIGRVVGPAAIVLPLLGTAPAVPVPGWIVAVAAVAGAAAAAFLLHRGREMWAHVLVGALPMGMLAVWLAGVLSGEPAGFLAGIKAPIVVYAGMLATAVSAGKLLDPDLADSR